MIGNLRAVGSWARALALGTVAALATAGLPALPAAAAEPAANVSVAASASSTQTPPAMKRPNAGGAFQAGGSVSAELAAQRLVASLPRAATLKNGVGSAQPKLASTGAASPTVTAGSTANTAWGAYGPIATDMGAPGVNGYAFSFGKISGRTTQVLMDPANSAIVYQATTNGGLWKSTDGGLTWNPLTDGLGSLSIGAIAIDPNGCAATGCLTIYLGTGEANFSGDSYYGVGMYKSIDGGATWTYLAGTLVDNNIPANRNSFGRFGSHISSIWVDPANSAHVLMGTTTQGLWASTNGGTSFAKVTSGLPASDNPNQETISEIDYATDGNLYLTRGWPIPNPVNVPTGPTDSHNGIYKSADHGSTWAVLANAPGGNTQGRIALGISPSNPSRMYAVAGDAHFNCTSYWGTSTDGGNTWTSIPHPIDFFVSGGVFGSQCGGGGQAFYDMYVRVSPTDPNKVYVGGIQIYLSVDGGNSFHDISGGYSGGQVHPDQHSLIFANGSSTNIYVGNDGGVWNSTDGGGHWNDLNTNQSIATFYSGSVVTKTDFTDTKNPEIVGGMQDNGTGRMDGTSQVWNEVYGGDGSTSAINYRDPCIFYVSTQNLSISKTADCGKTFRSASGGINPADLLNSVDEDAADQAREFIAPFVMEQDGLQGQAAVGTPTPGNPNHLYTGTTALYESTNGAASWTQVSPRLSTAKSSQISSIAIDPTNPNVVWAGLRNGRIFQVVVTNHAAAPGNIVGNVVTEVTSPNLPNTGGDGVLSNGRVVTDIAVDPNGAACVPTPCVVTSTVQSNKVLATYGGFNSFTPTRPGHAFMTQAWNPATPAAAWSDITPAGVGTGGNLDSPTMSVLVDPAGGALGTGSITYYIAGDFGFLFTNNKGTAWNALAPSGSAGAATPASNLSPGGLPNTIVYKLFADGDPVTGIFNIFAATHGRGMFGLSTSDNPATAAASLRETPNSFTFSQANGGADPSTQHLVITNNGGQTVTIQAVIPSQTFTQGCFIVSTGCAPSRRVSLAPHQSTDTNGAQPFNVQMTQSNYGGPGIYTDIVNIAVVSPNGGLGVPITIPMALVIGPQQTFYFAEGATLPGITETLSLFMPNRTGVATVNYFLGGGAAPVTKTYNLTAGQVTKVNVNSEVGSGREVSALVSLPFQGVAERHLDFGAPQAWHGSHDVVGTPNPNGSWNFAEGSTQSTFNEYLTIQNPTAAAVAATIVYNLSNGLANVTKHLSLAANSRTTVPVFNGDTTSPAGICDPATTCGIGRGLDTSATVSSDGGEGIIAERSLYVNGHTFGGLLGQPDFDGHDSFGSQGAQMAWSFAEGSTIPGFLEYLTIQNPNAVPANLGVNFIDANSRLIRKTFAVPGNSRATIPVFQGSPTDGCSPSGGDYSTCGVGPGLDVSASVASDQPVVVERPMYLSHDFGSGVVNGAHDALGATPGTLFGFAAATTTAGETGYLTFGNTTNSVATVTVTYYRFDGSSWSTIGKQFTIPATTRSTILLNDISRGAGPGYSSVGIVVSSDQPILVEKPTYSSNAGDYGATDASGYQPNPVF